MKKSELNFREIRSLKSSIGELGKAYVSLKQEFEPVEELHKELLGFGRQQLGSPVGLTRLLGHGKGRKVSGYGG